MAYRLKQNVENFEVVDGPFAGRGYVSGETYAEIPSAEAARFEKIREEKPAEPDRAKTKPEVSDA